MRIIFTVSSLFDHAILYFAHLMPMHEERLLANVIFDRTKRSRGPCFEHILSVHYHCIKVV